MDRRTALAGMMAAGLAVAGCDLLAPDPPPPHPLAGLLRGTRALHAAYQAAIAAYPDLAGRLTPLRDNHAAHVAELARLIGSAASPSATPAASAPADPAAALRALKDAERAAQQAAMTACLSAQPQYAGLIGSIAACRATHQEVLR